MKQTFRRSVDPRIAFAAAGAVAWAVMPIRTSIAWTTYEISIALLIGGLALSLVGRRRPWLGVTVSSLVLLTAVAFLRASAGGMASGAGAIALLPVFYTALYSRSRRALLIVLGGMVAFYLVPILVIGGTGYPDSQYRATLLSVLASSIIGLMTQSLVAATRREADDSGRGKRMLEEVAGLVRGLYESPQARTDVCQAARTISGASVAVMYEPAGRSSPLRCTATSGIDAVTGDITAEPSSAVQRAFHTGASEQISDNVETYVGSVELWTAAGRPASVLYEPLIADGRVLGVLVVGWPTRLDPHDPRIAASALLAREAATVIARADVMSRLEDDAQTDPLTGLPNRRAWDDALEQLGAADGPMSIALLDLDHFKQFNDTHGHPAGDRLLRATAAAWRDQLRAGDVLARIGGEEFGLLLRCDASVALDVVDRLRGTVSGGRTCSAGLATREPGEGTGELVARVDRALYQAKEAGRDRTQVSRTTSNSAPFSAAPQKMR